MNNGPERGRHPGEVSGEAPGETPGGQHDGASGGRSGDHLGGHSGTPDDGLTGDGLTGDERALRQLLHGAVRDLRPADGSLDLLRRAVPERRARKRQLAVGAAAAALLFGTAVPAFFHVAGTGSTAEDRAITAGHGEQVHDGTDAEPGQGERTRPSSRPPGERATGGGETGADGARPKLPGPGASPGASPGTAPGTAPETAAGSAAPDAPVCGPKGLGVTVAEAGRPEPDGKVYGTFRVTNVSGAECLVGGDGAVAVRAAGAADAGRIGVVRHTAGDPATGLPDTPAENRLLLRPAAAYEVKFAWVPSETCPAGGGGTSPGPSPSGDTPSSGDSGGTGGTGGPNDTGPAAEPQAQLGTGDGTPEAGSVTVTHTAEGGAPEARATVDNACAGTVYHTGALPTE
ncbi:hypothetical protein NX801_23955 [Streptomyces sp. LP05-1]|uniref:DUF4232 domain-containing protein n=1 Tax=Streptomyces pyxinae TaxID=2970734 RepID=A0ABT2CMK6_9ACTN|nr:hypothetical protein [Streptomyces sp. LP05-1]MCS0638654.1 hypothetical protein [Streptomyces sp. LP05-1]